MAASSWTPFRRSGSVAAFRFPGGRGRPMLTMRPRAVAACVLAALAAGPLAPPPPAASRTAKADVPARNSLRAPVTRERFYFVMPDRFQNADRTNDLGGLSGPREVTGYDPTSKGWYHGGDLRGLVQELPYIKGLGT